MFEFFIDNYILILVIFVLLLMALIGYYAENLEEKKKEKDLKEDNIRPQDNMNKTNSINPERANIEISPLDQMVKTEKTEKTDSIEPVPIDSIVKENNQVLSKQQESDFAFSDTSTENKIEISDIEEIESQLELPRTDIPILKDEDLPMEDLTLNETEQSKKIVLKEKNQELDSLKLEIKDQKIDSLASLKEKEEQFKKVEEDFSKVIEQEKVEKIEIPFEEQEKQENRFDEIKLPSSDISLPEIKLPKTLSDEEIWK